jgi:hypothetical protein
VNVVALRSVLEPLPRPEIARLLARHENVAVTQGYLHSNEVEDLRAAIEKVVERGV